MPLIASEISEIALFNQPLTESKYIRQSVACILVVDASPYLTYIKVMKGLMSRMQSGCLRYHHVWWVAHGDQSNVQ